MSEGFNAVTFAGALFLAMFCGMSTAALAQDVAEPSPGTHEALTGLSLNEVAPSGDILYQNADKELSKIGALLQRHYDAHVCFVNKDYPGMGTPPDGYDLVGGNSLQDVLPKYLGTDLDHVILMRVERLYIADEKKIDDACSILEFTYAYRNDLQADAPIPAAQAPKKKS